MAKRFLRRPYTFAQDTANYSAPGKAWDAQPKIVAPNDAQLNAGFTPNTGVDPTIANSLESDKADAISVAAHCALRSWTANRFIDSLDSSQPYFLLPVSPEGTTAQLGSRSNQAKLIVSAGADSVNGHLRFKILGNDPGVLSGTDAGFSSFACMATDDGGAGTSGSTLFGCELGSNVCKYYSIPSSTWFSFTPGLTAQATACFYTPGGHYLISDGASGNIRYATSLTGTWTSASFGSVGQNVTHYAAGNGVVVGLVDAGADSETIYSTTDGTSWATGHVFSGVDCSLTYNEAYALFVVVTTSGQVWTSPDGAAWTLNKTASVLATGIAPGPRRLASLGYAIVHLINRATATQKLRGVAYSFDLGSTWNEWYFGEYTSGVDLGCIATIDGEIWVSNTQTLWRSGRLSTPNTQYAGV